MSNTTTVPARRLTLHYRWDVRENAPQSVWELSDGRTLAVYTDGQERLFDTFNAFCQAHHVVGRDQEKGERRNVEAPTLPETFTVSVDWATIHAAAWEIDQARSKCWTTYDARHGLRFGRDKISDAYGGSYFYATFHSLAGLVKLANGTSKIARDAWEIVHRAKRDGIDIGSVRTACRVAIACSKLFALLHEAGLIPDPKHRICGTGPGYGLTGLKWLAGHSSDDGCTSEEVERFAYEGVLPAKAAS